MLYLRRKASIGQPLVWIYQVSQVLLWQWWEDRGVSSCGFCFILCLSPAGNANALKACPPLTLLAACCS